MATHKLNIARLRGCPPPEEVAAALEEYGLPEDTQFGVLNHHATDAAVFATVVQRTTTAVQRLDRKAREVLSAAVEKATVFPFCAAPGKERLEIYAGSTTSVEHIGGFLASDLALPCLAEPIELDMPAALEKLAASAERFQFRSVRVKDYAHNSFMNGPYAPKFLDSEHGREFLEQYAENVQAAAVRFQGPTGRVTAHLCPTASFRFSCEDDDVPTVRAMLTKLI